MILLCSSLAASGQRCTLHFSGKVTDAETGHPLPFATIAVTGTSRGVVADGQGIFHIDDLCAGSYTFECTFLGYQTQRYSVTLAKSVQYDFALTADPVTMDEVVVAGEKENETAMTSHVRTVMEGEELVQTRGQSLGEALTNITGVYALHSGPSIFKPVIHGLHSNRILIFNNGVRQEGQQWGSEHAPEIDPFVATKLTVLKGAASIRYGSDAIGGVVLVEPAALRTKPGLGGEINLVGATNNRMGIVSGILDGAVKKVPGLAWRLQGTVRRGGNARTPNYWLENTGLAEGNFSATVGYTRPSFGGEVYYSQFNTRLGIFTGTHAESIADIEAAIARKVPLTRSYFSYDIRRPYQQVAHGLFKASAYKVFSNYSRLDVVFALQRNVREEYDFQSLTARTNPELYLRLISHTLDVIYRHRAAGNYSGTVGFNGITQGNVREFQMLIPNFRNYGGGGFYMGKYVLPKVTFEGGLRYDYRWLRAYLIDNNTAQVIRPTWSFSNLTATAGAQVNLAEDLSWSVNAGTAWRAPTVNELLSEGVHQSAVAYERGNPTLHSERALNLSTSLHLHRGRLHGEVGLYENNISGYIYLRPDLRYVRTVRGSYPSFTYTQVDTRFRGLDLSLTWEVADSLTWTTKVSVISAWNKTLHNYLQLIPANRWENTVRYGFGSVGFLKKLYVSVGNLLVGQQTRVPANSDYQAPPPGYHLLNAAAGFTVNAGKQPLHVTLTGSNLTNVAYRDYMDRFRYFMDEPGRNVTVRLNIPIQ